MTYDAVGLAALADPSRRAIFEIVAERPRSVTEIARTLPISQPAVSQHLKLLKEARLVRAEPAGNRTIYHIDPVGLGRMRSWLDQFWERALASFEAEANEMEEDE